MSNGKNTIKQVCEVCSKAIARSLTHNRQDDQWYFCCDTCLDGGYYIMFERLGELDWYTHMMKKGWVDQESFMPRFTWAYKNFHGKELDKPLDL